MFDEVNFMMSRNRNERGFKNESLALAQYTSDQSSDIGIFFVCDYPEKMIMIMTQGVIENNDANVGSVRQSELGERIFTSISDPRVFGSLNKLDENQEYSIRRDFDTDNVYSVLNTTNILNYLDIGLVLKDMGREDLLAKEYLTNEDLEEIVAFAKANAEKYGFSIQSQGRV